MMDWYRQRDTRERLILALGALLAALIVGWGFVWKPLDARALELSQEAGDLSRLVVDLERAATLRDSGSAAAVASGSLLSILDQAAQPLGLASKLERQRQESADSIYVSFRDAPFDALNTWLIVLDSEYGLSVESVSGISAAGAPGLVTGQVLLTRS
jgi:general secretion pathway protein M